MKEKCGFYAPDRRAATLVADVPAAIDIEYLAGHEVCGFEVENDFGDIADFADAPHRMQLRERGVLLGRVRF
jgi:hypothetical protein